MRVVGYTRVSTEWQVDNTAGLETQADAIRAAVDAAGHELVAWCSDEGVSGKEDVGVRTGLGEALALIDAGEADAIMVHEAARLARDVVLQERLLQEVWSAGGQVLSCVPSESAFLVPDDPKDPSRKLIRVVLGAVGEYERALIRMRLSAGIERKKAAGGFGGGRPPYGWRSFERELVPVLKEQKGWRLIHEWAGSGVSCREVAERLNDGGLLRPDGSLWHHEKVRRALRHAPVEEAAGV